MEDKVHQKTRQEDNDLRKGATENTASRESEQNSMQGQLGHRNQDAMLKDNDSDYPEPGSNPEHSGQTTTTPEAPDSPGDAQKKNQNWRKEDLLAS